MAMMSVFALFCIITSAFAVEIFVSTRSEISRCPEDTLQSCSRIPVTGHVRAIDYDPLNGYLYWADWYNPGTIFRARLDGTDQKVLFSDVFSFGIRLDVQSRQIFWTNFDKGTIERGDISGSNRTVIVSGDGLREPHAITLDPTATPPMVYWTTVGSDSQRIERADYNGERRQQLVSGLSAPYGFALDTARGLMYWADRFTNRLEVTGLDGSGRTTLRTVSHDYWSMDYFGDQLYLGDRSKGILERYSTVSTSTGNAPVVVRNISDIYRVRVVGELSSTTPAMTTTPTTTATSTTTTSTTTTPTTSTTPTTTPTTTTTTPTTTTTTTTSIITPTTTTFTTKKSSSTETTSAVATTSTSSVPVINIMAIIGISVAAGAVVLITAIIGVTVCVIYRRRERTRVSLEASHQAPVTSSGSNYQYLTTSFIDPPNT